MKKIVLPFVAFGLLATPAFMGSPAIGGSAEAKEVGIRVAEDRDRDHDRDYRWWWHHRDRDDFRRHRDHDRDDY